MSGDSLLSIESDIQVLIDGTLSPQAQSLMIAEYARATEKEVATANALIIGRDLAYRVIVDGVLGALEERVRPTGTIIYEFEAATEKVLQFISRRLHEMSPVGGGNDPHSGLYQSSHELYADGVKVDDLAHIPEALEYVFLNPLPYAMRIELGESAQADHGVYELVAYDAEQEFPTVYIEYNLRSPITTHDFGGPDAGKYISVGHGTNKRRSRIISEHNESRVPSILVRNDTRTIH